MCVCVFLCLKRSVLQLNSLKQTLQMCPVFYPLHFRLWSNKESFLPVSFIATAITSQPIVFIVTALIMFKPTFLVFELLVGFSTKENFLLIHDLKNLNLNNLKNVAVL